MDDNEKISVINNDNNNNFISNNTVNVQQSPEFYQDVIHCRKALKIITLKYILIPNSD